MPMPVFDPFDGALLIDKPAGLTSHDVVARIRRRVKPKKVGHCGTLAPTATGLLILGLGRATKLSEKLMAADKAYEGTVKFGETTNSYDADGELVASLPVPPMTLEEINDAASAFIGDQMQAPPMVSAAKVGGVPLYKLARKGVEVERKERLIHVYTFVFTDYREPVATFRIACTKGTYVRSLAHEMGQKLGCGAHLATLRRTEIGQFHVSRATPLDEAMELTLPELQQRIIPLPKLTQFNAATTG
jgi:tRNA pseudouridine55 synthase